MKGDFTRDTFRQGKHYSSVRMQQGRVQLDSDWNEQVDIQAHLQRTEAIDVIGCRGAPMHWAKLCPDTGPGFSIDIVPDTQGVPKDKFAGGEDLSISPGRIYVDGILCELESTPIQIKIPSEASIDILNIDIANDIANNRIGTEIRNRLVQVPVLAVDGIEFKDNQWVEISGETDRRIRPKIQIEHVVKKGLLILRDEIPSALKKDKALKLRRVTTYLKQPDYSPTTPTPGRYLLYLDVWQRHITCLEDPEILEDALGGPDTTTRTKTIWQAKLEECDPEDNCDSFGPHWVPKDAASTGMLAARAKHSSEDAKPCELPAQGGYRGLENQLYRVEFHKYDKNKTPYFKWSRDNGSVVARCTTVADALTGQEGYAKGIWKLTVSDIVRNGILGFATGQWVEITDNTHELLGKPGIIAQVVDVSGQNLIIDANNISNPDNAEFPINSKIRRWDGFDIIRVPTEDTSSTTKDGWIRLGDEGVEIKFDVSGTYQTGDYWIIPVRTASRGTESDGVIWPRDVITKLPLFEYKHGIEHHYCPLAICVLKESGIGRDLEWTKPVNCAPTFLTLTEISNKLENLPDPQPQVKTETGCCTFTVGKGTDLTLKTVLSKLADNTKLSDVCICLLPGEHPLGNVKIERKPESQLALKIKGCGKGSLINLKAGNQIMMDGLRSVILEDLEIRGEGDDKRSIMVVLKGCDEITVSSCRMSYNSRLGRLLEIGNTNRVRIEKSVLDATYRISLGLFDGIFGRVLSIPEAQKAFSSIDNLRNIAGINAQNNVKGMTFSDRAAPIGKSLNTLSNEERISLGNAITNAVNETVSELKVKGINVSDQDRLAYDKFATYILASGKVGIETAVRPEDMKQEDIHRNSKVFEGILRNAARSTPNIALVLYGITSEAMLEDNQIIGTLSLYAGLPEGQSKPKIELIDHELNLAGEGGQINPITNISALIKYNNLKAVMHLRGNRITQLAMGNSISSMIQSAYKGEKPVDIGMVFHQIFMTNNILERGQNQLLAEHITLTSNRFDVAAGAQANAKYPINAGYIIASSSMYIGNSGNIDDNPDTTYGKVQLVSSSKVKNRSADMTNSINIIQR